MIGRAASWMARRPRPLTAMLVGGAATAGVVNGLRSSDSLENVQEQFLGDRRAVQAVVRGSAAAALSPRDDIIGMGDSYYGQNVAFPAPRYFKTDGSPVFISGTSSGRHTPVGGEIVFGQYNMRR